MWNKFRWLERGSEEIVTNQAKFIAVIETCWMSCYAKRYLFDKFQLVTTECWHFTRVAHSRQLTSCANSVCNDRFYTSITKQRLQWVLPTFPTPVHRSAQTPKAVLNTSTIHLWQCSDTGLASYWRRTYPRLGTVKIHFQAGCLRANNEVQMYYAISHKVSSVGRNDFKFI